MWSYFSSSDYEEIKSSKGEEKQENAAQNIMQKIGIFYISIEMTSNINNTNTLIKLIEEAIAMENVRNNIAQIKTLFGYLMKTRERILQYQKSNSDGLYKMLFWSAKPLMGMDIEQLAKITDDLILKVSQLQVKLLPQKGISYQAGK